MHVLVCIWDVVLQKILNDVVNYMVHKIVTKIVQGVLALKASFIFFFLLAVDKLVNLKGDAASH